MGYWLYLKENNMKFKVSTVVPHNTSKEWIAHLFAACAMCDNELIQKITHQKNYDLINQRLIFNSL